MGLTQTASLPVADTALLAARAEAAVQAGDLGSARAFYENALQALNASDAPALRVRALGGLGWTLWRQGDFAAALQWYEQAFATQLRSDAGNQAVMLTLHSVIADSLMALGRFGEALAEYETVLGLGTGVSQARATVFGLAGEAAARAKRYAAARQHQDATVAMLRGLLPPGHVQIADALSKLGYSLLELGQWDAAEPVLREALAIKPEEKLIATNLVHVLVKQGRQEQARGVAQAAYWKQSFTVQPPPPDPAGTLLMLWALEGNIPSTHLVPRLPLGIVDWHVDFTDASHEARLPRYDIVLNLIGDADVGGAALAYAEGFKQRCTAPMLNDPAQVGRTQRHRVGGLLAAIPGLVVPRTVKLTGADAQREDVLQAHGLRLPVLLRDAGRHGGETVHKLEQAADLTRAAAALAPDAAVYLTDYHDYASPDGLYRKYRAIFVDRVPMPYHLAISTQWLVHYFSAEMEHDARLAEEIGFLANMQAAIGPTATTVLDAIAHRLDLDYCGADFSLLPDGRVLLFESNATMLVHPEAPDSRMAGKNLFIDRILRAFDGMVMERAGLSA